MDFFDHQDQARSRSRWLVLWFSLAVVGIVVAVYAACTVTLLGVFADDGSYTSIWNPQLFAVVAFLTLSVIGLGSLYKSSQLRSGGAGVAERLGGRLLGPASTDLKERRLLNIVEEMALAAGLPVPPVYVMDEELGINAFAAGMSPADSVIGVTRGSLELLDRDELQGVIGHEFSHILNGDTRLNLRLMGLVHGILVIALVGWWTLRSMRFSGRGGRRGGGGAIALFGLALVLIGWIGVFFGRLIKSSVSRQREFLADASAVQFTRNPAGLAGALAKIGGLAGGGRLESQRAEEASHMFFGNALKPAFFSILATHPPIDKRIRRIDPNWNGLYPAVVPQEVPEEEMAQLAPPQHGGPDLHPALAGLASGAPRASGVAIVHQAAAAAAGWPARGPVTGAHDRVAFDPVAVVGTIGTLDDAHRAYAASLLQSLPAGLRSMVHEPAGAVATVYALLLDDQQIIRDRQLELLAQAGESASLELIRVLHPQLAAASRAIRLPLLDLSLPALRELSAEQYQRFTHAVRALVLADEQMSLFELALQRLLSRHLAPTFEGPERRRTAQRAGSPAEQVSVMLSALAYAGGDGAESAFGAAAAELRTMMGGVNLLPPERCGMQRVDQALRGLAHTGHRLKRQILLAAATAVVHDGVVTIEEGELLRAIADSLDCPMPPLLPGLAVA